MNRLELYVSNRYIKQYEAASITLKNIILKTIYDFVNGFYKNPMEVTRGYDRVNRISSDILEMKVSGGYRLLAMYTHGQLFLLAVGDHDCNTPQKLDHMRNESIM